jgi:glutathione S-transferase
MKLFDHPDCPYGMKVRIVLAESGHDFELVTVDLQAGQQRSPEFLRLNPFGKVPVLVDEDLVVYDSTIINEYINDEYIPSDEALLPEDSGLKAKARMLEDYADHALILPAMAIERELARPASERDPQRITAAQELLRKGLAMLERELDGKEYLVGSFSLADIACAPILLRLDRLGVRPELSLPNVKGWTNRLVTRQSIGTVLKQVA